ncbi:MAG: heme exporter protein CcmB [Dehalococcoidia bacterium]|jgi:heme exporter protein CcmB|tara:strand:- start:416 stop:1120 length:705 start_codon:yes stop_codon:yes gene_type:complete
MSKVVKKTPGDLESFFHLLSKDLRLELRSLSTLSITVIFTAVVVSLFNITFPFGVDEKNLIVSIIIWVIFLFSSLIVSSGIIEIDMKNKSIDLLFILGIKPEIYFLSKVFATVLILSVVQIVTFGLFYILFQFSVNSFWIVAVALIVNVGISTLNTILGIVTSRNNVNQNLLSILVLPFTLPFLMGSVEITNILSSNSFVLSEISNSMIAIFCFDLIFLILGAILTGIYFKLEN